jgi:hypothetical protein
MSLIACDQYRLKRLSFEFNWSPGSVLRNERSQAPCGPIVVPRDLELETSFIGMILNSLPEPLISKAVCSFKSTHCQCYAIRVFWIVGKSEQKSVALEFHFGQGDIHRHSTGCQRAF